MAKTEIYNATEFMANFYSPIADGMADDSQEEREAEAADYAKNYKGEVISTMKSVAERMNNTTSMGIGKPTEVLVDEQNLIFTIKYI